MISVPEWSQIWWTEFDEVGRRPALVLTRPEAVTRLPRILVAPATTNIRGLPSEVLLGLEDGLERSCVLNLDTPELVSRFALVDFITTLSPHKWLQVCSALEIAVNCNH